MLPKPKDGQKHWLEDLELDEVSLVDKPCNKGARVALWKRDNRDDSEPATPAEIQQRKEEMARLERLRMSKLENHVIKLDAEVKTLAASREQPKEIQMSKYEQVIKSSNATRDQVCEALEERAQEIKKRDNISIAQARVRVLDDPAIYAAYERAPVPPVAKREPVMKRATPAELAIDTLARKHMRKTGLTFAKSVTAVLDSRPDLYDAYTNQIAAGDTQDVEYCDMAKQGADETSDGECPACAEPIDSGDKFCASCGKKITR